MGVIIPGLNSKQSTTTTSDGSATDSSGDKKPEAKPAEPPKQEKPAQTAQAKPPAVDTRVQEDDLAKKLALEKSLLENQKQLTELK